MPNFFNTPYGLQAGCAKNILPDIRMIFAEESSSFTINATFPQTLRVRYNLNGEKKEDLYPITQERNTISVTADPNTVVTLIGEITYCFFDNSSIKSLDISRCYSIQRIEVGYCNRIDNIRLNDTISELSIRYTSLGDLDLSPNKSIEALTFYGNNNAHELILPSSPEVTAVLSVDKVKSSGNSVVFNGPTENYVLEELDIRTLNKPTTFGSYAGLCGCIVTGSNYASNPEAIDRTIATLQDVRDVQGWFAIVGITPTTAQQEAMTAKGWHWTLPGQ